MNGHLQELLIWTETNNVHTIGDNTSSTKLDVSAK